MPASLSRYCKRCRQRREVDWRNPGTLVHCPACHEAVVRNEPTSAQREESARGVARKKQRIEEVLAWVNAFKIARGCQRCGERDPAALDCHRRDPAAKAVNVATLVRRRPNLAIVAKELETCDVLCASCGRKEQRPRRVRATPARDSVTDALLQDLADGSVQELTLRRTALVQALDDVKVSLEALRVAPTRSPSTELTQLESRRRALSVALMKLDSEISARSSTERADPAAEALAQ